MLKAYKYRIYPTFEQEKKLNNIFGANRFIYNLALETKKSEYKYWQTFHKEDRKYSSIKDIQTQLPELKKLTEAAFLNEAPAISLISSLRNLDTAYSNFFRNIKQGKSLGFPKFKKRSGHQSFKFQQSGKHYVDFDNKYLSIPKVGQVKILFHRPFIGELKDYVTISKTPSGKHYISILCDSGYNVKKIEIDENNVIGIDLGINSLLTFSDGKKVENPKYLIASQKKLRIAKRALSRKKKGSNRYKKEKIHLAKIYETITNQRKDFLHKISSSIVKEKNIICIEDLNVKGMSSSAKGTIENPGKNVKQKSGLNKSILDASFAEIVRQLEYKSEWNGKYVVKIDRFFASSKTCNCCGAKNTNLKLSDRNWTCETCGTIHDRDINAAKNIKDLGLKKLNEIIKNSKVA